MNHINLVESNNLGYVQCNEWDKYNSVLSHFYTLKTYGNDFKKVNNIDVYEESYNRACKVLGITRGQIAKPIQKHTDNIFVIQDLDDLKKEFHAVDALITDIPNICLSLTYADCTPIYLLDPIKKVIGLVHSGWKGTVQKIGQKTIRKMMDVYHCNSYDIEVYIGPCIRQCHFEVDEDVKDLFVNEFSDIIQQYSDIVRLGEIKNGKQKYYIDTTRINIEMMKKIGIEKEKIYDSEICTVCDSNKYHSYRVEKTGNGLNTAVMMLK